MSTYTHSRRRTVLRAAVATAALAGALLAPSAAAFAADAPKTADASKAADAPKTADASKAADAPKTADASKAADAPKTASAPKAAAPAATATATDGELVGHPVLADGIKGDLWKKGKGWYYLDVHTTTGMPIASFHVGGPSNETQDGQQVRGMWVTLDDSGQVRSWKNPATGHGFDAGGTETREGCTVSWSMGTPFDGVSLRLSNGTSGPVAQLIDGKTARTLTTLTTANRTGLAGGARIKDSDDPKTPQFQMRVVGGQIPWEGVSFPKPPKDCAATPTTKPTATAKPTPAAKPASTTTTSTPAVSTHNVAQTSVLPKGGVAAGAEIAQDNPAHTTALVAGGASTLALGAAAAGFVALRRRTANQN
ncbi:hypothetical protein ACQEVM_34120 [Streptomyces sp. CA-243310]|uniref:hypothetical protein n=1 Tax=Streptomyces sp. CA-243310 TaxID=3240056 RepID=UPI003D8EC104